MWSACTAWCRRASNLRRRGPPAQDTAGHRPGRGGTRAARTGPRDAASHLDACAARYGRRPRGWNNYCRCPGWNPIAATRRSCARCGWTRWRRRWRWSGHRWHAAMASTWVSSSPVRLLSTDRPSCCRNCSVTCSITPSAMPARTPRSRCGSDKARRTPGTVPRCRSSTTGRASMPANASAYSPLLSRRERYRATGSGLGLSIVREIARLHRAHVDRRADSGGGLTVTVLFRRVTDALTQGTSAADSWWALPARRKGSTLRPDSWCAGSSCPVRPCTRAPRPPANPVSS